MQIQRSRRFMPHLPHVLTFFTRQRIVIVLLILAALGAGGAALAALGTKDAASVPSATFIAVVFAVCAYISARWNPEWMPIGLSVLFTLLVGATLPEPFVTQYVPFVIVLPFAISMILVDTRWLVMNAVLLYGVLITRAQGSGVYSEAFTVVLFVLICGCFILSRLLVERAVWELQALNAELEQRVADRTASLQQRNEDLEQAQQARLTLISEVVHDQRNVGQALVAHAWGVKASLADVDAPDVQESVGELERTVKTLMSFTDDLNDAVLAETGELTLEARPFDLAELTREVGGMLAAQIQKHGLTLTFDIAADLPDAYADRKRITRVLYNLLHNAHRYTREHGGGITLRLRRSEAGNMLIWECSDTGRGIDPADLHKLGRRLLRLAQGENDPGGTGIGLSFCTRILALTGGTLSYASQGIGHGTTVTVQLPVAG